MDSDKASHLMSQMIERIHTGLTDGQAYVEEIFKLLRGEGYSPDEIAKLFMLKRRLQLTIKHLGTNESSFPGLRDILADLQRSVR